MSMNVVKVWDGALTTKIDDAGAYVYMGEATAGSDTVAGRAAPKWRISRVTAATGDILWASQLFNQVWDNRTTLTYS